MQRELVEIRDAGDRGARGLFARACGVPAGTDIILAEPPLAHVGASSTSSASASSAPDAGGEEVVDDTSLRLLLAALSSPHDIAAVLCAGNVPEETRAAMKFVAGSAVRFRSLSSGSAAATAAADEAPSEASGEAEELAVAEDLLLRLFCNTHSLDDGGAAVYAEASAINHDCNPNCTFFTATPSSSTGDGAGAGGAAASAPAPTEGFLTVRTVREVKPGEELTVSYCPLRLPARLRQLRLRRNYGFGCECSRCENEFETEECHWKNEQRSVEEAAELEKLAVKLREFISAASTAVAASASSAPPGGAGAPCGAAGASGAGASGGGAGAAAAAAAGEELGRRAADVLERVSAIWKAQPVVASEIGMMAAEALTRLGRLNEAVIAFHDVLERARSLEAVTATAPFRASVACSMSMVLLRMAAVPELPEEVRRVTLSRAEKELGMATAALRLCRGEAHEATQLAEKTLERAKSMGAARKEAMLLKRLMERQQSREAAAASSPAADAAGSAD